MHVMQKVMSVWCMAVDQWQEENDRKSKNRWVYRSTEWAGSSSLSLNLIEGLLCKIIKVVSYACDGMETEQSVQKLIKQKASVWYMYQIKHQIPGCDDIIITIAMTNGQLVVMIQDLNHGLKALWNNLHTGVKVLTLDNHVAMYLYNQMAAFKNGCPLYHHNVEETDQQDDNAAIHAHSGSYIEKTEGLIKRLNQFVL